MPTHRATAWIETAPSLVFFALWRGLNDVVLAGWVAAAALAFGWLIWRRRVPDTIILGINLHFLLTPPVIASVFAMGLPGLAAAMAAYAAPTVPAAVALTGLGLTMFTKGGFLGAGKSGGRSTSWLLAVIAGLGAVWGRVHAGNHLISVGLPLGLVFAARAGLRGSGFGAIMLAPATSGTERRA
ncbi:MAG: hypothetical protein AAGE76_03100 [Pseudomonadota bacterium]